MGDFNGWDGNSICRSRAGNSDDLGRFFAQRRPGAYLQVFHHVAFPRLSGREGRPLRLVRECRPHLPWSIWDLDYRWGDERWMRSAASTIAWKPDESVMNAPGFLAASVPDQAIAG